MDNNQITKRNLIELQHQLNTLLQYYKELKIILEDNLLINDKILNYEKYDKLYSDVYNVKLDLDELINTIDYYN